MDYGNEYRNLMAGLYTSEELDKIASSKISISGVGGSAGSYLVDLLIRKGFENFIISEPDKYEIRNISRQLYANTESLNKSKLEETYKHMLRINPNIVCKLVDIVNLDNIEEFVSNSTVVSHQAEGFSSWVLTQYMCSKKKKPFVNVARKGNIRTVVASRVFDYNKDGDIFNIRDIDFESFGIPKDLIDSTVKMFDSGDLSQDLLDEVDYAHNEFKKKKRFVDLGEMYPEVGSIKEKFPDDYTKRYTDPEVCYLAAALGSRTITDLVVGRKTNFDELGIFSRK